jgi:fructose-bisphosphate aldolase class II
VVKEKLYTTSADMVTTHKALSPLGHYLLAATFGNVHGVYKPGNVVLNPKILKAGQDAIAAACNGENAQLVFHGGSGSTLAEIHETLDYGVVKMNIDTDTQYAFSRPVADHFFKNYDGVLKLDGEVGNKKVYDPRSYLKKAETGMAERVLRTCQDLRSAGKSLGRF